MHIEFFFQNSDKGTLKWLVQVGTYAHMSATEETLVYEYERRILLNWATNDQDESSLLIISNKIL